MSKELRFKVSEILHAEITQYVHAKKRAGEMFRSEMGHFLRDAARHEMDRYPLSEAARAGTGRKRGRPLKTIQAVLPDIIQGNLTEAVSDVSSLAARAQGINSEDQENIRPLSTRGADALSFSADSGPNLVKSIEAAFLSKARECDYLFPRERPAVKRIAKMCFDRDDPERFAIAMISEFWRLVNGVEPFWNRHAFMPRILAGKLWDQVAKLVETEPVKVPEVTF